MKTTSWSWSPSTLKYCPILGEHFTIHFVTLLFDSALSTTYRTMFRICSTLVFLFVAALLFTACDAAGPEPPDLDGKWVGMTSDFLSETWTYTITDDNGQISGSLSIVIPVENGIWLDLLGSLSGSYDHPLVEMRSSLPIGGFPIICTYQANVSDSRQSMSGTCSCDDGTEILSASLTLRKQSSDA